MTSATKPSEVEQRLETILLPVSDPDASLAYYRDAMGWHVDVDHERDETFRVVQVTPPGSTCSVSFGIGITDAQPGSLHGMTLVVADIELAANALAAAGASVGAVRHMGREGGGWRDGPDPERRDYNSFAEVTDPDGNTWSLQEVGHSPSMDASERDAATDRRQHTTPQDLGRMRLAGVDDVSEALAIAEGEWSG